MNYDLPIQGTDQPPVPQETSNLGENYLDLFYAALFQPARTFQALASGPVSNRLLFFAFITVLAVSALAPVVALATTGGRTGELVVGVPLSALSGVFSWAFMALVIGLLAYAFTGETRIKPLLVLSGLATLPWVFMGPAAVLKLGFGSVGLFVSAVAGLLLWLWSVLLFALAIAKTYAMSLERVLIVLAAPYAMLLVVIGWLAGFISNVRHLLPWP